MAAQAARLACARVRPTPRTRRGALNFVARDESWGAAGMERHAARAWQATSPARLRAAGASSAGSGSSASAMWRNAGGSACCKSEREAQQWRTGAVSAPRRARSGTQGRARARCSQGSASDSQSAAPASGSGIGAALLPASISGSVSGANAAPSPQGPSAGAAQCRPPSGALPGQRCGGCAAAGAAMTRRQERKGP
jgi:hypothetical protein